MASQSGGGGSADAVAVATEVAGVRDGWGFGRGSGRRGEVGGMASCCAEVMLLSEWDVEDRIGTGGPRGSDGAVSRMSIGVRGYATRLVVRERESRDGSERAASAKSDGVART